MQCYRSRADARLRVARQESPALQHRGQAGGGYLSRASERGQEMGPRFAQGTRLPYRCAPPDTPYRRPLRQTRVAMPVQAVRCRTGAPRQCPVRTRAGPAHNASIDPFERPNVRRPVAVTTDEPSDETGPSCAPGRSAQDHGAPRWRADAQVAANAQPTLTWMPSLSLSGYDDVSLVPARFI